jgi:hypothetical protein
MGMRSEKKKKISMKTTLQKIFEMESGGHICSYCLGIWTWSPSDHRYLEQIMTLCQRLRMQVKRFSDSCFMDTFY